MIKKTLRIKVVLLVVSILFVQSSLAQDYTRWSLPEGAIARLGKGGIMTSRIRPTVLGLRSRAASGLGSLMHTPARKLPCWHGKCAESVPWRFRRMELPSRAGVVTVRYCCGIQRPGGTREPSKGLQRGLIPLRIHRMERRWQVGMETIRFVCGTP